MIILVGKSNRDANGNLTEQLVIENGDWLLTGAVVTITDEGITRISGGTWHKAGRP